MILSEKQIYVDTPLLSICSMEIEKKNSLVSIAF